MVDPRNITLLTGEEEFSKAVKTFSLGDSGEIEKVSDYGLGRYFCHRTETLAYGLELESLQSIIMGLSGPESRVAEAHRTLRVYAEVKPFVGIGERTERNGEFMDEPPDGSRLLVVDVDGWEGGLVHRDGNSEVGVGDSQEGIRLHLHSLLNERGLEYLVSADCLLMYSQSAFPGGSFKCHLYYWLDRGFTMEKLRAWAAAVNSRMDAKVIDGSVYRAVQPDYISRRLCIGGLVDPLDEADRMFIIPGFNADEADVAGGIDAELTDAGVGASGLSTPGIADPLTLANGWYGTCAKAGTGGEVNEWCFRAAAQCVQANGRAVVLGGLDRFAAEMHTVAWLVMSVNSDSVRGGSEDIATYNVARFAQYLRSACDRKFGDEVDGYRKIVEEGCERAVMDGSPEPLYEKHVLSALLVLERRWPGVYDAAMGTIRGLPARIRPSMPTLKTALGRVRSQDTRVSVAESLEALGGAEVEVDEVGHIAGGGFIRPNDSVDESAFIDAVLDTIDLMSDGENRFFIDLLDGNGSGKGGSYTSFLIQDSFKPFVTVRAMEIIGMSGRSLPEGIVSKISSVVEMNMERACGESDDGSMAGRVFGRRDYRERFYNVGDALWINLGAEADGVRRCLRVVHGGCSRMTWSESARDYADAPIWSSKVGGKSFSLGDNGASWLAEEGVLKDMMSGVGLRGWDDIRLGQKAAWVKDLFRLIRVDNSDSEADILVWLVSVMLDWHTKFILQFVGHRAAGKSTSADILSALVNPPGGEADGSFDVLSMASKRCNIAGMSSSALRDVLSGNGIVSVIDNIGDGLTKGQQNLLSSVATGDSVKKRVLYTNMYYTQRTDTSLILTGLADAITLPDLRSRVMSVQIRSKEQGTGYVSDLSDFFLSVSGGIRDGLVDLCSAVISLMGNGESGSYLGRDGLSSMVRDIYFGSDAGEIKRRRELEDAETDVDLDLFSKCFSAWILFGGKVAGVDGGYCETATRMLGDYSSWVGNNFGKVFDWVTSSGDDMSVKVVGRSGGRKAIPTNPSKMAKKLVMFGDSIEKSIECKMDKKVIDGVRYKTIEMVNKYAI